MERKYVKEVTSSGDVIFKDGSSVPDIDIVFYATGWTPNYDIIELEGIKGNNGYSYKEIVLFLRKYSLTTGWGC